MLLGYDFIIRLFLINAFNKNIFSYLQFFFNSCLAVGVLYLILKFWITILGDVEQKVAEYSNGKFNLQVGKSIHVNFVFCVL